ncbi:MAG: beta-propeller fold lactonase family protein, partial [Leptospiraceae bacterium]|nr:beta-propeller fold lactonase family protein [Leptospiraceae bacterium]
SSSDYGKLSPIAISTPVVQLEGTVASQNPLPLKLEGFTEISPLKALVDPTGRFLYVLYFAARKIALFHLDSFTGLPSFVAAYDTGVNPSALSLDQSGRFMYVANGGSGTISIYAVNPSNGRLKGIGTANTGIEPVDIRLY